MANPKRDAAAMRRLDREVADKIQGAFVAGYDKLVQRGDLDAAVRSLAELLASTAEAIEEAERTAEAAKRIRIAIIKAMMAVGMTMEDVGAVHGLTRQRIGQILKASERSSSANRNGR